MPKKQYDIDMLTFLYSLSLETFTVSDVTRQLLLAYTKTFKKKKDATQFVYRQLKNFEKQKLVQRLSRDGQKAITFCLSEQIRSVDKGQKCLQAESTNYQEIVVKLQKKIRRCKVELFTNFGETEAYSEWIAEMPTLEKDVEKYYQNTREQAQLMLGKIKGFERLLEQYQKNL